MTNEAFKQVGKNLQEKATVIWNIANHLAGPFKPLGYPADDGGQAFS